MPMPTVLVVLIHANNSSLLTLSLTLRLLVIHTTIASMMTVRNKVNRPCAVFICAWSLFSSAVVVAKRFFESALVVAVTLPLLAVTLPSLVAPLTEAVFRLPSLLGGRTVVVEVRLVVVATDPARDPAIEGAGEWTLIASSASSCWRSCSHCASRRAASSWE